MGLLSEIYGQPYLAPRSPASARRRLARRALPPQREAPAFTRPRRLEKNVTATPGRRIVNGLLVQAGKEESATPRQSTISEAAPFRRALAAFTAKASAADRRYYTPNKQQPTINQQPKTVFGTEAWLHRAPLEHGKQFVWQVMNSAIVVPCIARAARREVLFAFNLYRHGNHKKGRHRKRGPYQHMRC